MPLDEIVEKVARRSKTRSITSVLTLSMSLQSLPSRRNCHCHQRVRSQHPVYRRSKAQLWKESGRCHDQPLWERHCLIPRRLHK